MGRTSDFSGVDRVTSAKSATDEPRRPGEVGLYLRMAMRDTSSPSSAHRAREDVDALAVGDGDDRALGVGTLPEPGARAPLLPLAVDRVHPDHADLEDLLDRDLDLGLVRARGDEERVLVLVQQR